MDHSDLNWEDLYTKYEVETMSWYYPKLDRDFEQALKSFDASSGRALDMGTGPGTQALELAKMGFSVTATDLSRTAVDKAAIKAEQQGLVIDFRYDDILNTKLKGPFDYIFDRGLFHVIPPDKRQVYVKDVCRLLTAGGYLLLKCFSQKEKRQEGPHRLSPEDIRNSFKTGFEVVSIVDSVFQGNMDPKPKALFCVIRKV